MYAGYRLSGPLEVRLSPASWKLGGRPSKPERGNGLVSDAIAVR